MERELKNAVRCPRQAAGHGQGARGHLRDLDIPAALVKQEIDGLRQQMFQQFGGAGTGIST
jgi:trigger factor